MRGAMASFGLALGVAAPAGALTIPTIQCENANGTLADEIYVHDAADDWLPGMTTYLHLNSRDGDAEPVRVITHCASRQAVSYLQEMNDAAADMLHAAMTGDTPVTLRQLARQMKALGVDATFRTVPKGHCACDPATHRNSF